MANPTPEDIQKVLEAKNDAQEAANYADTLKFKMELVSGENYRMIWSTEYNGGFTPNN